MNKPAALPEKGMVFPEFALIASDDRTVTHVDFDGRKKVFFFCAGPQDEATAQWIADAAGVVEAAEAVLVPVSATAPVEWRRFLRATGIEGIAPLSLGGAPAPFPTPSLVYVDEQDEVLASAQNLDVKALLKV